MAALIQLKDVTKEYNGQVVLRGIDLEIDENQFVTLLGPSGCGKTTTLRIIGGFLSPSAGEVLFDGKDILQLPAHKRPTNTVFQRYALFPHLNVYGNIAFGLKLKEKSRERKIQVKEHNQKVKAEYQQLNEQLAPKIKELNELKQKLQAENSDQIDKLVNKPLEKLNKQLSDCKDKLLTKAKINEQMSAKINRYLKMVGLEGYEDRQVSKLSGGQQQRVAIARALINEPKVLLLDEPLAALDLKLRQEMQYELKEIQRNAGITFIFVTHDQEEALTMSDKIVVMNNGEIQQIGSPIDIYNEPANRFVASFIGESNIINGIMKDDLLVHFDNQDFICVDKGFGKNEKVDVIIRPEDIDIVARGKGKISGIVDSVVFKGVHYEIEVKTKERYFTIHTTDLVAVGSEVDLDFFPEDLHVMEVW